MTLVTEIMMDEAGFVINEDLKDCKRQTDLLEIERTLLDKYQYNQEIKTNKSIELKRDADTVRKELIKTLQEN